MLKLRITKNQTLQIPVLLLKLHAIIQHYFTRTSTTFLDKCSHFSFKFYFSSVCTKFRYSQVLETNCKGVFVIKFELHITVSLKFQLEFRPKIGSFNLDLNFMHLWQHCSGIYFLFRASLKITSGLCFIQYLCVTLKAGFATEKCQALSWLSLESNNQGISVHLHKNSQQLQPLSYPIPMNYGFYINITVK